MLPHLLKIQKMKSLRRERSDNRMISAPPPSTRAKPSRNPPATSRASRFAIGKPTLDVAGRTRHHEVRVDGDGMTQCHHA